MRRYKYQALIQMDPPPDGEDGMPPPTAGGRLTVRAYHRQTHRPKFFTALVTTADGAPLRPVGHSVPMTLTVLGDDVLDYLGTGDHLALWRGHDIGHGVITRRLSLWVQGT